MRECANTSRNTFRDSSRAQWITQFCIPEDDAVDTNPKFSDFSRHQLWSISQTGTYKCATHSRAHFHTRPHVKKAEYWCVHDSPREPQSPAEEAALINSRGRSRYRRRTIKITVRECSPVNGCRVGVATPFPSPSSSSSSSRSVAVPRIRQSPATPADCWGCRSLLLLLLSRAVSW